MVSVNTTSSVYTPGLSVSQCTTGRKYSDVPAPPGPGVPVTAVAGVVDIAVPAPVDVRLHSMSLAGFAAHAPALALHTYAHTFMIGGESTMVAGVILLAISPWLKKIMHGVM